jgi:Tfp pilus assembly protein FimT
MRVQWNSGFSLVDGMVAIMVCGVLTLMAGPLFYRMAADQRVTEYSNTLSRELGKARHAALYESTAVSVCSSDNGQQCTATPWSKGYIVFTDNSASGVVDGNDRILRVVAGKENNRLRVTLDGADLVRFQRSGAVVAGASHAVTTSVAQLPAPSLWNRLSPIASAHAADLVSSPTVDTVAGFPRFKVCSGAAGRALQFNAVGRVTTISVACQ